MMTLIQMKKGEVIVVTVNERNSKLTDKKEKEQVKPIAILIKSYPKRVQGSPYNRQRRPRGE
jgi:hypothetical protein